MNRLEQLFFSLNLIDNVSNPLNGVTSNIDNLYHHAAIGSAKLMAGTEGLAGIGEVLSSVLDPANEMDKALGEVASLGVETRALDMLESTALKTSVAFGTSATDIVSASYDIQSAIAGLSDRELSSFTKASAILAKGTKADTDVITDYMGTMYGIFKNTAAQIGKSNWVETIAGQTASAVNIFATTGGEMAAAFGNLGAEAQSQGIAASEQMAILGTLQATMSGSESGTKYRAFLNGIGKAQNALNLNFTDSNGKMLSMVKVLDLLKGKFGVIDTVAESDALKKAFGTSEAVGLIKLLMQDTNGLAASIDQLGRISGMDKAITMANNMVDPWERSAAAVTALKTVFGRVLQPILVPLVDKMTSGADTLLRWTELFPHLTRTIGIASLGFAGLIAGISTFAIVGGIASLTISGFHTVLAIGSGIAKIYAFTVGVINKTFTFLRAAAIAGTIHLAIFSTTLSGSTAAAWLFNAALWANPVTWIVLGVTALIGSLALLAIHWDTVSAAVGNFFNFFAKRWTEFSSWISDLNMFDILGDGIDWLIEKINLIPGIHIDTSSGIDLPERAQQELNSLSVNSPRLTQPTSNLVPPGGLLKQVNNTNNNRGISVENLNVNTTQPVNGNSLVDELLMSSF